MCENLCRNFQLASSWLIHLFSSFYLFWILDIASKYNAFLMNVNHNIHGKWVTTLVQKSSVGTIWNPANVCCVQFSASSGHMLAFGSADYKVYCYDLRHDRTPWCTLVGHEKAVSYVKFLDANTIVSASTDNTLKLWDLNKTSSTGSVSGACTLTFNGHTNKKVG